MNLQTLKGEWIKEAEQAPIYSKNMVVIIPDNTGTRMTIDEITGCYPGYVYRCHGEDMKQHWFNQNELLAPTDTKTATEAWSIMMSGIRQQYVTPDMIGSAVHQHVLRAVPYDDGWHGRDFKLAKLTGNRLLTAVNDVFRVRFYGSEKELDIAYRQKLSEINATHEGASFISDNDDFIGSVPVLFEQGDGSYKSWTSDDAAAEQRIAAIELAKTKASITAA